MEMEFPIIRKHRFTKDFSWGFYCTENQKEAEKMASKFKTSVVNVYRLSNIDDLKVKIFNDYTDEWLDLVIHCRNGGVHDYDVVIGAMADDTSYEYLEAYEIGKMNKEILFEEMKCQYPLPQISFHTIQALDCIEFIESYQVV